MGNPAGVTYGNNEELERKAWFFAKQKMRPYGEKHKANTAASRVCQAPFAYLKAAAETPLPGR
jgi:hypothetical protein